MNCLYLNIYREYNRYKFVYSLRKYADKIVIESLFVVESYMKFNEV